MNYLAQKSRAILGQKPLATRDDVHDAQVFPLFASDNIEIRHGSLKFALSQIRKPGSLKATLAQN